MGWGYLFDVSRTVRQLTARNDDDMVDRLSHRWTSAILVLLAMFVTTATFVGEPIACWCPKHFADSWRDYANKYCWVRNTYYLPFDNDIPSAGFNKRRNPIIYYQWVPIILMVQALLFYLPIGTWRYFNNKTGIEVNDIVETAERYQNHKDTARRKKVMYFLTNQMNRYLGVGTPPSRGILKECRLSLSWILAKFCCFCCGKRLGNYMTGLYMFTKVIFLVNVIGQIYLLHVMLGQDFRTYGVDYVKSFLSEDDWEGSSKFPRVALCDMTIRRLGNLHRYSLQCVLPINLFNERIFLFLWFWYVIVAVATACGILLRLMRTFLPGNSYRYIREHLIEARAYHAAVARTIATQQEEDHLRRFVYEYLRQDGVLVLRLVGHNTNGITVREFICALWDQFRANLGRRAANNNLRINV